MSCPGRRSCLTLLAVLGVAGAAGGEARFSPRLEVDGFVEGLAIVGTENAPRQRPGAFGRLGLHARLMRHIAAQVTLQGGVGGPYEGGHPGAFNFVHMFQNYSPRFEVNEGFVDVELEKVSARIGIQRFAWGKLDGTPPTDVLNPREFHDPIVRDLEESKIGVPAVQLSYYPPDLPRFALSAMRATLVYVPIAVPARLPLRLERWFPSGTQVPAQTVIPRQVVERALQEALDQPIMVPGDLVVPNTFLTKNRRPPDDFSDGGIAARLAGTLRGVDWELSHYSGPETAPVADVPTTLVLEKLAINPAQEVDIRLRSISYLRQKHATIHMTGGALAAAIGSVTVRAEIAGFLGRPYPRVGSALTTPAALRQLPLDRIGQQLRNKGRATFLLPELFVERDTIEWGIGADLTRAGTTYLLQVNQIAFLEPVPQLLVGDPDTRFIGVVRRSFLGERLQLELRSLYALEQGAWFVLPRVTYQLPYGGVQAQVGYLAIGGSRNSLIGQYGKNDEVVFALRRRF